MTTRTVANAPIAEPTRSEQAYRRLRRALVSWELQPGTSVSEARLQELTGLGRTPTREAAGRLIEDALLTVIPRAGYRVADVWPEDAAALYEVWEALAPMTGRLAANRVDPAALTAAREVVDHAEALSPGDLQDTVEQLFEAVLRATGNPWLERVGSRLCLHLQRLWAHSFRAAQDSEVAAGFARMLHALVESDPDVAAQLFLDFTAYTRTLTLAAVQHR